MLRGVVRVMRTPERVDFVMRDHHTLDALLYHYATTGQLPAGLFHADRHSDWCTDATLMARVPEQAATWWALLEGVKRPGVDAGPVLREREVLFCTAQPAPVDGEKNVGASLRVPGCVDRSLVGWDDALGDARLGGVDWVSLDLDYFQPARQLRLSAGLIRDPRFAELMGRARVRLFVLSPQFLSGGDRIGRWEIQGSLHSSARLLNLLRR
ncbi:MAG: hypothetical protein IRZ16_14090 [Myxococcaceae bacterium]|nr:hypothetical protein [Myxococcaceae bacterium]